VRGRDLVPYPRQKACHEDQRPQHDCDLEDPLIRPSDPEPGHEPEAELGRVHLARQQEQDPRRSTAGRDGSGKAVRADNTRSLTGRGEGRFVDRAERSFEIDILTGKGSRFHAHGLATGHR
jgi:hypothetical protein